MHQDKPRPAREIVCARCDKIFYHKHQGNPKYCPDCRVIVYDERRAENLKKLKAKKGV